MHRLRRMRSTCATRVWCPVAVMPATPAPWRGVAMNPKAVRQRADGMVRVQGEVLPVRA